MLSIVKLDLDDTGGGDMDIQEDYSTQDQGSVVMNSLELIPVVYTTRLDDMAVLKSPSGLHPNEITARILRESKPLVFDYSSDDHNHCRKNAFRSLITKLNRIYKNNNNLETKVIKSDISTRKVEEYFVKEEESEVSEGSDGNGTCKYKKLLKLCRPVSVVLTRITEIPDVEEPRAVEVSQNDTVTIISSSDDDEPLVNSVPIKSLNNTRKINKSEKPRSEVKIFHSNTNNSTPSNEAKDSQQAFLNFTGNRLLLNGLMEMHDFYSQEFNSYITDGEGLLIDYYTDHIEKISKYKSIENHTDTRLTFLNCCWVQRDQYIRSMYPKVLMYSNFRFMRKQHTCPLGECICCCRNKKEFLKPDLLAHSKENASGPAPFLKEDLEIQRLESEIEESIISMNKTPRLNSTEWLQKLIPAPKFPIRRDNLIDKALQYKNRLPKKNKDNRHLLTIKSSSLQFHVVIFRNFATNLIEIYELNLYGELKSYMKVPYFSNTTRPDIKKLTSASKSIRDVCCWFKRELFISQLLLDKTIALSAARFIRSRHMCSTDVCSCCCKPAAKHVGTVHLKDISILSRLPYWQAIPERSKISTTTSINNTAEHTPLEAVCSVPKTNKPGFSNLYTRVALPSTASSTIHKKCKNTSASSGTKINPLPPEQVQHIANVIQNDEMSGEVNTLIMSILERFKDVRLTISGDGKVAAALNTPVNTLSTVELKVLANILSYAQSQINLLGLNSGMSLSSVINMNIANKNPQNTVMTPDRVGTPSAFFPKLDEASTKEAYEYFTKTLSAKNKAFKEPFSAFLAKSLNVPNPQESLSENVTPVIQSVFTLKKEDIDESKNDTSTLWYNKPDDGSDNSGSVSKVLTHSKKRTQENTASVAPKRIRVVSPKNLGAPVTVESQPNVNLVYNSTPLLNSGTLEVGNLMPGVPLLSNPNFKLVVNPKAQLLGMNAMVIPSSNAPVANASSLERTLVITPLPPLNSVAPFPTVAVMNNSNVNQISDALPVTASVAVAPSPPVPAVSTPVASSPIKSEAPSDITVIKTDDDGDDDDVCILGM